MQNNYCNEYLDEINRDKFLEQENTNYYADRELQSYTVENAVILPYKAGTEPGISYGGVLGAENNYLQISAQRIVGTEMCQGYEVVKPSVSDKSVIWFGAFHTHWGHFLTEMVSRCWYLAEQRESAAGLYVAYVRRKDICDKPISGNYLEFLELLGVKKEHIIEVSEPTQFREVIIPELSCRCGEYYTDKYKFIFNSIRDHVNIQESIYEKVYFTRLESKNFRDTEIGEKKIKRLFEKNNYKVLAPEHCSLRQQIHHIKNCKELTVISGTLPHNILFAQDDVKLTIINRTGEPNYYQSMINQVRNAKVTYIDAHLSLLPVFAGGPFLLYVSENLLKYAEINHFRIMKTSENPISLHIKLTWYFLYYLESMSGESIRRWKLDEKYGMYIMSHYAFYRDRIPNYDKKTLHRLRKCFYLLASWIG